MFLDSTAIIEFFIGSQKGKKVGEAIAAEVGYISEISLPEIAIWCLRENLDIDFYFNRAKEIVDILSLSEDIYKAGARIAFERQKKIKNFGLLDGLILASARSVEQKLMTKDSLTQWKTTPSDISRQWQTVHLTAIQRRGRKTRNKASLRETG